MRESTDNDSERRESTAGDLESGRSKRGVNTILLAPRTACVCVYKEEENDDEEEERGTSKKR